MRLFQHIGEYTLLMGKVLRLPDRQRVFWRQYSRELEKQGLQSLPIVLIISVFIGASRSADERDLVVRVLKYDSVSHSGG